MIISATNFTATFSKIGYLGIKRCLDKGKVNYSHKSIVQAYDLKETLEELGLKKEEGTIGMTAWWYSKERKKQVR